mmetsp:Transcript_13259/g.35046  ORF Transcript_13259/g.35046 Transcript_13259/m.35046 type:complete len:205 (+) Transcript_13259:594-1208(+)
MLEGKHPMEGARVAGPHREHDPPLCQVEGGLVDECHLLQSRAYPPRRHCGQDDVQEEPRPAHAPLAEGGAGAPAQLPQGRPVRERRGGGGHLHHDRALARVAEVHAHPVPAAQLQARHEAPHPGARAPQGAVHGADPPEPAPARGAGSGRAGLRQPPRGAQSHQAPPAHAARLQGGHDPVPGHVLAPDAHLRDRAAREDHGLLP